MATEQNLRIVSFSSPYIFFLHVCSHIQEWSRYWFSLGRRNPRSRIANIISSNSQKQVKYIYICSEHRKRWNNLVSSTCFPRDLIRGLIQALGTEHVAITWPDPNEVYIHKQIYRDTQIRWILSNESLYNYSVTQKFGNSIFFFL